MTDPAVHLIEGVALTAVTALMVLYLLIFLLTLWADRPVIGREPDGRPRAARPVDRSPRWR